MSIQSNKKHSTYRDAINYVKKLKKATIERAKLKGFKCDHKNTFMYVKKDTYECDNCLEKFVMIKKQKRSKRKTK